MSAENASETVAESAPSQNNKGEGKRYNNHDKPIMQARNKTGVVKWFSFKNGYGFITVDGDGDDIFVHRSEFIREGAREVFYHLDVGDKLEFDIINRAKGREAVAVTGPNGMRIPGTPANYGFRRGGGGRGRFPRNRADHFVDAEEHHDEDAENKPPNGEARKRGGGRGVGRRRSASNDENGGQNNQNAEGKKGNGRRRNFNRRGGGPRTDQDQPEKKE